MTRRDERTSKTVASKAARALKDPKATKREKSLAGSALTQKVRRKRAKRAKGLGDLWKDAIQAVERYYAELRKNMNHVSIGYLPDRPKAKRAK